MKALKTNISVTELQKIIKQWKKYRITDSAIPKLLELYLGLTAYMNSEKTYPIENFYDISLALKFKNARFLIESVKQCRTFGIVAGQNLYGVTAFYSPLWLTEKTIEDSAETLPVKLPQDDNIYNNISKEQTALAAAKEFFHLINETPEQKMMQLTPLINWFQLHEKLNRQQACENLIYLVNELLIPYFAAQERFLKSNHIGRLCWLGNLIKSAHGQHLLNTAAADCRKKRQQTMQENRSNQRSNHPINEFEWTDPETGLRFYDDDVEGMVSIPNDAPPRPSATAIWNVLSRGWF